MLEFPMSVHMYVSWLGQAGLLEFPVFLRVWQQLSFDQGVL